MTIIDAMKSGRPYQRTVNMSRGWISATAVYPPVSTFDILSSDWVLQDASVTVSKPQYDAAWLTVVPTPTKDIQNAFAKAIGFVI